MTRGAAGDKGLSGAAEGIARQEKRNQEKLNQEN
jgi:hypothetical protein